MLVLPRARAVAAVIPAGDSISTLARYVDQAKAELYIITWALLGPCASYRSNRAASLSLPLTCCQATTTRSAVQRNFVWRLNPYHTLHNVHDPLAPLFLWNKPRMYSLRAISTIVNGIMASLHKLRTVVSCTQFRAVSLSASHSTHEVTSQVANNTGRTPLSVVASGAASQQQSTTWEPKRSQHQNVLVRRSLPPNQHLD